MLQISYVKSMAQCQLCLSINTNGRADVEGDTIALCAECEQAEEQGITITHDGEYVVAASERWGDGKTYMWPLNKKRSRR